MEIALASDHAGFDYKERLKLFLIEAGHVVKDFGTHSDAAVDYPLFIRPAAQAVARGDFERGIIFGGSGNGEAIVANRVHGIRCIVSWNVLSAQYGRRHNDANMLSLGQRMLDFDEVLAIVECWLETPFDGGRHLRRIREIDRPPPATAELAPGEELPHRTELVDEGRFTCNSCREEFLFPVDLSAGSSQEFLETCPVCSHENVIQVQVDEGGELIIRGDEHITG